MKCFKSFVDEVTAARRLGDLFDAQEILSNLAKLLGYVFFLKLEFMTCA